MQRIRIATLFMCVLAACSSESSDGGTGGTGGSNANVPSGCAPPAPSGGCVIGSCTTVDNGLTQCTYVIALGLSEAECAEQKSTSEQSCGNGSNETYSAGACPTQDVVGLCRIEDANSVECTSVYPGPGVTETEIQKYCDAKGGTYHGP